MARTTRDNPRESCEMRRNLALPYFRGIAVAVLLAGCASQRAPTNATAAVAVTPGNARIWFYRDYEPSVSMNLAAVDLNGQRVAYVPFEGTPIYRDVEPGRYHVTVESEGTDVNQDRYVELSTGQEAFVKVLASSSWENGGDMQAYKRDTFYVSLMRPQVARAEMASH
jgi:hypothetical protein